jgi:hypothetical protein
VVTCFVTLGAFVFFLFPLALALPERRGDVKQIKVLLMDLGSY